MKNIPKNNWHEISEDATRQYIDAKSVFAAHEKACQEAAEVRGGMYWKHHGQTSYLIRTSARNSQKSLGPRSAETEAIYQKFTARKADAEQRLTDLSIELVRHQRMNRALHVGHAPKLLVEILSRITKAGLADYFTVVGTHALYAYEAAAGVRFSDDALATRDVDLMWDVRKRLSFVTQMNRQEISMLKLLQKVDPTFRIRHDQSYTAVNSSGFEVDIIRREICGDDPHPIQLTDSADDFYVVPIDRLDRLQSGRRFSEMIVASTGHMARMNTVHPLLFAAHKHWMSELESREPLKKRRDLLQANLVQELVEQYLPHLTDTTHAPCSSFLEGVTQLGSDQSSSDLLRLIR